MKTSGLSKRGILSPFVPFLHPESLQQGLNISPLPHYHCSPSPCSPLYLILLQKGNWRIHLWRNKMVPVKISQSIGIWSTPVKRLDEPHLPPSPHKASIHFLKFSTLKHKTKHKNHQSFHKSLEWKLKMKINRKRNLREQRHTENRRKHHRNFNIYREITAYITP